MNQFSKSILIEIHNKLTRFNNWLSNKINPVDKKQVLNSLAPKVLKDPEELKKIKPYLDGLRNAIDTPDLNNIALTGGYGSGKSTILKTFQFLNNNYRFLNISLASFDDNREDKEGFERKLEVSILQQMFYQVRPNQIPDSRFKRIANLSSWELILFSLSFIIWFFSCFVIFKFNYLNYYNPKLWNLHSTIDWWVLIITMTFLTGIGFFIKGIYRFISNSKISKVNIKGEFEIGETNDKSVFNQHLEEILYFFERQKFDVVIIEDIDRFKSTDIFTKLREVNTLINSSKSINYSTKFVYAVKDDMFSDKSERVKFFDFIIPVIPFINPGNANEQLRKLIEETGLGDKLSVDFISDLVTYVDDIDMRLLINIFQEFQIYSATLNEKLDRNKIFAILIYKNLYPSDFACLLKRNGKLFNFFNSKSVYLSKLFDEINEKINQINNEISIFEKEEISSLENLRVIYLTHLISKIENFKAFVFAGKEVGILEATNDKFFESFTTSQSFKYVKYSASFGQLLSSSVNESNLKISSIEKSVDPKISYRMREKIILDKINYKKNQKLNEVAKLKWQNSIYESYRIRDIFTGSLEINEYLNEFDNKLLLRSLILNGYIDEHYEDYISLFHGVNLTQIEYEFERNVKSYSQNRFDLVLKNFDNVLKRIPDNYFFKSSTWNYTLVDFLILNKLPYKRKYHNLFESFIVISEELISFFEGFMALNTESKPFFVKEIFKRNRLLCSQIISSCKENDIHDYIVQIFNYVTLEDILEFELISNLDNYISNSKDFMSLANQIDNTEKLMEFLKIRNIKVQFLDLSTEKSIEITRGIYLQKSFALNISNVELILLLNKIDFDTIDFRKSIYTSLKKYDLKELNEHIENQFNHFLENVLISVDTNVNESEEVIVDIINQPEIDFDLVQNFLSKQTVLISDLKLVNEDVIKSFLISNNKVELNWSNVIDYYMFCSEYTIDEVLFDYLSSEKNYKILTKQKILSVHNNNSEIDFDEDFCQSLIFNMDFDDLVYSLLIQSVPYKYSKQNFDTILQEKASILLDSGLIELTLDNYNSLKANYDNLHIRLVELNWNEFLNNYKLYPLDKIDWEILFESKVLNENQKNDLLHTMDHSIIYNNLNIAKSVFKAISLDFNFNSNFQLLKMLTNAGSNLDKKISFVITNFATLDNEQIISIVSDFGEDYSKMFMRQHKPTFEISKLRTHLFELLEKRNLISRFKIDYEKNQIKVIAHY